MDTQDQFLIDVERKIYVGSLMNPQEVAEAVADRGADERARLRDRWVFCCDVASSMFEHLKGSGPGPDIDLDRLRMRTSGFKSSLGGCYGVVTHQVEGHQHRLLLPLYDAEVQRAVTAVAEEPFGFLMSNDNQGAAVIVQTPQAAGVDMQGLPGLHKRFNRGQLSSFIGELPLAVMAMAEPCRIPSLNSEPLYSVSLSIVMPNHSMLLVDETLESRLQ